MWSALAIPVAVALSLVADGPSFETLAKGALPLDRPAQAVAVLVGACDMGGGAVSGACLENTKDLKDKVSGRRVAIDLGAGHDQLLSYGGRRADKTRFVWAPLYDVGNGLALTVGRPDRVGRDGTVVLQKRPVDGDSPDELTDLDLRRIAGTGMLGIRVVGRFGKPWSMTAPGGKTVKGVAFEVEALQLYNARTGAVVFESTQALK